MNIISSLIGLIGLFLICGVAALGLLVVLLIVTARLPPDNPLRRILHALSVRLTAMLGVGAVAVPIQPIVGLDALYDAGALLLGVYLSYTFFRELAAVWKDTHQPQAIAAGRVDYRQEPVAQERHSVLDGRQLRSGRTSQETRRLGR